MKLAYATVWIASMNFTTIERTGFDHIASGEPYVPLVDLPSWETPETPFVEARSSWFVLTQDVREGIMMTQDHMNRILSCKDSISNGVTYVIVTLRQVIELVWARSETLYDGIGASDTAIDMILWAINTTSTEPPPISINLIPIEIQDRILYHATTSFVAAAKLGCEISLGLPFSWVDRGAKIKIVEVKRHRNERSPTESQVFLNGVMSGLSYKRERRYQTIHARLHPFPTLGQS